ncbi:hypothetical protein X988_3084 [Burkholderia pseudomallei TSV 48]|nr:hypothetical protein X988_3084 [Burkholderia pseudomallei TSV 48]
MICSLSYRAPSLRNNRSTNAGGVADMVYHYIP